MLIYYWKDLYGLGILQILFWSFHYNAFAFLLDHPEKPVEANLAYFSSFISQVDWIVESDLISSMEAVQYFSEEKNIPSAWIQEVATDELGTAR